MQEIEELNSKKRKYIVVKLEVTKMKQNTEA